MTKQKDMKKNKYNKVRFLIAFVVVTGLFAGVRHIVPIEVSLGVQPRNAQAEGQLAKLSSHETEAEEGMVDTMLQLTEEGMAEDLEDEVLYSEVPDSVPFNHQHHETVVNAPEDNLVIGSRQEEPMRGNNVHRIRGVWSYADCFPDIQDVQIVAAKKYGVTPVRNRKEAEQLVRTHQLVNICHSPFYTVDELTHSIPYLVPRAQHLLNTICLNFIDSCQVKGMPVHLLMVTSVMRTTEDVSSLQQGNKNATTNSCHCYGTTVDIAYNRFMPVSGSYKPDAMPLRWNEPMKQVLAEVLDDLRRQGKCYVKYEKKQGCFHLTCR